jgi:hypothetical protein
MEDWITETWNSTLGEKRNVYKRLVQKPEGFTRGVVYYISELCTSVLKCNGEKCAWAPEWEEMFLWTYDFGRGFVLYSNGSVTLEKNTNLRAILYQC